MFCPHCGTAIDASDRFCRACGAAQGVPGRAPSPPAQRSPGTRTAVIVAVTAAGLILLIAIAGVIAAVAVPHLGRAAQRERQDRTITDMKTVASAVEAYAADHEAYPEAGTIDELAAVLEPKYIRKLPRTDGWDRPFKYESWLEYEDDEVPAIYALGSAGSDGVWERQDLVDTPEGRTTRVDADIVLVNGAFVQFPEGADPGRSEERTEVPPGDPPEPEGPALRSSLASPAPIPA